MKWTIPLSVRCTPNDTTAEPAYRGHPAKPKKRMALNNDQMIILEILPCLFFPFWVRSESVRNPSDRHTQTLPKQESADNSCTQTRALTTRPCVTVRIIKLIYCDCTFLLTRGRKAPESRVRLCFCYYYYL